MPVARTEMVIDMLMNTDVSGYAHVVKKGLTMLLEGYDYGAFLNHQFRSPVDTWLYKQLAGIRINGFSFDNVVIQQRFIEGVSALAATLCSITVCCDADVLTVQVPYPFALIMGNKCPTYPTSDHTIRRRWRQATYCS